jgi:hypothetical protein
LTRPNSRGGGGGALADGGGGDGSGGGAGGLAGANGPGTGGNPGVGGAGDEGGAGAGGAAGATFGAGGMATSVGGAAGEPSGPGGAVGLGGAVGGLGGAVGGLGGAVGGLGGAVGGLGGAVGGSSGGGGAGGAQTGGPPCSDLFASTLQTFSIEISAGDWQKIHDEFVTAVLLPPEEFVVYEAVYYPIIFHYGAETVADAFIKLKGDSSWQEAVSEDGDTGKMQFVVAFDRVNSSHKFHSVSKLGFDMPRTDPTFLRERIGDTWLRSIGIPTVCTASARLEVNGSYYGLYVLQERVGHGWIKGFFPGNGDGDLFKEGWEAKTNESSPNTARLSQFWGATDPAALAAIVDIPHSLSEWAAEAILNDGDGYYGGAHNFYIYDQGAAGYVFLPDDLDSSMDYLEQFTSDPVCWWSARPTQEEIAQHYLVVMNDPALRAQYVAALAAQLPRWDVALVQSWIDTWAAEIRSSVATDPHRPIDMTLHDFDVAIALARRGAAARKDYLARWLACAQSGVGVDQDGDGVIWCNDCRDDDASIHRGAPEICGNGKDDNCNGLYDEGCPDAPDGGAGDGP